MRTTFFHFCIALLILFGTVSFYGFWYAAVSAKSSAAVSLENRINAKLETASRIASARVALADISDSEETIRNYFVSGSEIVQFINDLEARGRVQGAKVNVLSVLATTEGEHPALSLTVTTRGTFESVMRTVGSIEYAPYYVRVGTVSLNLESKNVWRADIAIVVGSTASSTTP